MVFHCMHRPDSMKGKQAAQHQLLLVDKFNRRLSHDRQYENLLPTQAGASATPSSQAAAGGGAAHPQHRQPPQYSQQPQHLQQHLQQGLQDIVQCKTCGSKYNRHGPSQHAKLGRCTREPGGKWGNWMRERCRCTFSIVLYCTSCIVVLLYTSTNPLQFMLTHSKIQMLMA